ncbi:hypothetical protein HWQ46_03195 [Shewanella sp. D64]|uniref:hypothetical protein n=1 Tax=unclassified Shewanella TaxID=196818 RepID=UPI0022BA3EAA|nr:MULTISPECIES: hypothetical protein [unclassified Shewanella]MEC4724553.1 hypothetical protein [Shewanella sp. D64]MEC4736670.1 hypothetical protein [Shewanella sp. E94]WBJ94660.1 hypothetical protein HWQ47_22835 [Shewanella sp. MTB7]
MSDFLVGVLSSVTATIIIAVIVKWIWPAFKNKCLYNGIRIDGEWDIVELRNNKNTKVGRIKLNQDGRYISGSSHRSKTRDGKQSERKFEYSGVISGNQITLIFEDSNGVGFDTGTYVFTVLNDKKTMDGMATFHGRKENKIVSEPRTLSKVLT